MPYPLACRTASGVARHRIQIQTPPFTPHHFPRAVARPPDPQPHQHKHSSAPPAHHPLSLSLSYQGSFREHMALLARLPGVTAVEVRTPAALAVCDGVIIPGGESTTMALVAEQWGLLPVLREFAGAGKPVWGTCAGLIFLAARAVGQKKGGQALLGGLDVTVSRNFFGGQVDSFEASLPAPPALPAPAGDGGGDATPAPVRALFIRAPAVLEAGPGVEVLASLPLTEAQRAAVERSAAGAAQEGCEAPPVPASVAVAVRQGHLLATSFHPELTDDTRWHALFVGDVRKACAEGNNGGGEGHAAVKGETPAPIRPATRPADLPVLAPGQRYC